MFKKILKSAVFLFVLSAVFSMADFCFAQDSFGLGVGQGLLLGSTEPRVIIVRIIQIILGFLGLVALILIIYAGFLWMTSAGDESKVERAKKIIINAVIGIVIILSSFAITTYLINRFSSVTGGQNGGGNGSGNVSGRANYGLSGAGVLGACSIESVYPSPNQKNVARNSSILITFKEEVDPSSICSSVTNGLCGGSSLLSDSVRIYKTEDESNNYLSDIKVYNTGDNKNFIFSPSQYLGSDSEDVSYSVNLSDQIKKIDGTSVFEDCNSDFMNWSFEVSNNLDLTPPQIKNNGIWPLPDDSKDEINSSQAARAAGSITVISQPSPYVAASVSDVVGPDASVLVDKNSSQAGVLTLSSLSGSMKWQLKNMTTGLSLGTANFNINNEINFPGILTLRADNPVEVGKLWTMNASAAKQADTITIDRKVYVFVTDKTAANQIVVGADTSATAANIAAVITGHPEVNATAANNVVSITAANIGSSGNLIPVISSDTSKLRVANLSGGSDLDSENIVKGGQEDKPMNSAIKINFNETILPSQVVGSSDDVYSNLRIINNLAQNVLDGAACSGDLSCRSFNCDNGRCLGNQLAGEFKISNQYKTVEFVSNKQCGTNGCGEPVYCLPAGGNILVEVMAASLQSCSGEGDCASKTPYNNCTGGFCKNGDEIYPQANQNSLNGIVDSSFNSLDGNRDGSAVGPQSFYSENSKISTNGDNFSWSFLVSDKIDTSAPSIISITPDINSSGVTLKGDIEIIFNKPMLSSSLKTGSTKISSGEEEFIHKNINIWSLSNYPVGYWIESEIIESSRQKVFVKHGEFGETLDYRMQVGSGVRDIYQNCFNPSAGPKCNATESSPSCCNGNATSVLDANGNCQ